jgi:exosortase D (VPLPA-CTERM-specific)
MLKTIEAARIRPMSWVKAGLYAIVIFLVYKSALLQLVSHDWAFEDYSHSYLVPFIVLYLVWEKRKPLATVQSRLSWSGLIPFALGIALFWLGDLGGEFYTLYVSFWLVVVALLWIHLGWQKIKTIWFALIMVFAAFPFPNFVNTRAILRLKLISSQLGVWMLHTYGMSAYREGNVIDLGFTQLQVVDACSGLRYILPLMVLSVLLAYWFRAHWWKRIILFLSAIPLAIFVNAFRIALTGILYSVFGAAVAEGFFHGFSGWLIFLFCIPILLLEMWILRRLPPRRSRDDGGGDSPDLRSSYSTGSRLDASNPTLEIGSSKPSFFQPVFITAMVLLVSTAVLSGTVEFREKTPIKKPLSSLPLAMGEWSGSKEQMEQEFVDELHFSDYAMVDYRNDRGQTVNFYTAYYESQRKGYATHSPETCLPGNGWIFREAGAADIPVGPGKSMRINRAFIEKTGTKELTYYWFAQRGRILTSLYQVKIYSFWDALTKHRTDGALVRLITPVYERESVGDAETRLQGFTKAIVPVLKEYIPE